MIFEEHSHVSMPVSWRSADAQEHQPTAISSDASSPDYFNHSVLTTDEKFELLSAYLDGEVTREEKCLVEHWISSDPEMKEHHEKQLRLKDALKSFFADM